MVTGRAPSRALSGALLRAPRFLRALPRALSGAPRFQGFPVLGSLAGWQTLNSRPDSHSALASASATITPTLARMMRALTLCWEFHVQAEHQSLSCDPRVAIPEAPYRGQNWKIRKMTFFQGLAPNFSKLVLKFWKLVSRRKYALTPRIYALTSRNYFKIVLWRDLWTIFGFMAHPPHRGFTMILTQSRKNHDSHRRDRIWRDFLHWIFRYFLHILGASSY